MRAAVVLVCASCSFHPGIVPGGGSGADDAPGGDASVITYDGPPSDWWNPAWTYRMRLSIAAPTAVTTGFQVGFAVDLDASPCTGSRDGARIVRNQTEVTRVVDELGPPQWVWFRLGAPIAASGTSTDYWLYCHNASSPPAPADPTTVFDLYDDFSGSSLKGIWAANTTVTVGGGVATLPNGVTFHSTATYPAGTATDFTMAPQAGAPGMWFWGGFQNGTATSAPWTLWNTRNEAGIHPEINDGAGGAPSGASVSYDTSFRLYGVENYGAASMYRLGDAAVQTIAHAHDITQAISVRFDNYSSSNTLQVTMARVRGAVNPPPAVTVGQVETFTP